MRLTIVVIGVVLVGLIAAFEEQDHSREFDTVKERQRRWLFSDNCKAHGECGSNGCCKYSWFGNKCVLKQAKFQRCHPHPKCGCRCQCRVGLECKLVRGTSWPYVQFYMCLPPAPTLPPTLPPTEEPGSGDFV